MKITGETKLFLGILISTACIVAIAVAIMSMPPKPLEKSDLLGKHTSLKGNLDAPTWLVEFSDFECPACKAFSDSLDSLIKKYPDELLIAYRHFPLPQHAQARNAAIVAQAAKQQGKFWEMATLLFSNQNNLTEDSYASLAATLSLDATRFAQDRKEASIAASIDEDVAYATQRAINATPTFYLNGVMLNLRSPDDLVQAVDTAIKQARVASQK